MTLRLGVIGTSWITAQFIDAAYESEQYELTAVYSRTLEKGQAFLDQLATAEDDTVVVTNLTDLWTQVDVVYIASPNSVHFSQTVQAIDHDINVIVEKPATSNVAEFQRIMKVLQNHPKVRYFEAARHVHQPNMRIIKTQLENLDSVDGATFVYQKYSSKFDQYLAGKPTNVFEPAFSGGALYDLGVYTVYAAIMLFGKPNAVDYHATRLASGVDGRGTAILSYDKFDVTLIFGKNSSSYAPSEIYSGKQTIVIDDIAELTQVTRINTAGQKLNLGEIAPRNPMVAEATDFAKVLQEPAKYQAAYNGWLSMAEDVTAVLYQLRQSAGITFLADEAKN